MPIPYSEIILPFMTAASSFSVFQKAKMSLTSCLFSKKPVVFSVQLVVL